MAKPLKKKRVVVIGGGTGTSMLLRGLRQHPLELSAIITTADTGGSSGRLRKEFGMAPPGDARQCFVALNHSENPFLEHFNTRFASGSLRGHTFGNLFFALLWQYTGGDFQKAIEEAEKIFQAKHSIIPVTKEPTNLIAHLKNGKKIQDEASIIKVKNLAQKLHKLELTPAKALNPKAEAAVKTADCIIIGPGNLFASLTPPLLVEGFADCVKKSKAKKVYVANLMNQQHLTKNFTLKDYLNHFEKVFRKDIFDYVVYNTKRPPRWRTHRLPITDEPIIIEAESKLDPRCIGADLVDTHIRKQDPNDPLKRTYIRHDPKKIAKVINSLINGTR